MRYELFNHRVHKTLSPKYLCKNHKTIPQGRSTVTQYKNRSAQQRRHVDEYELIKIRNLEKPFPFRRKLYAVLMAASVHYTAHISNLEPQ